MSYTEWVSPLCICFIFLYHYIIDMNRTTTTDGFMRSLFLTSYKVSNEAFVEPNGKITIGSTYTSYVLADSLEDAQKIIAVRGLHETIDSLPSNNYIGVFKPLEELFDKIIDKPPSHRGGRPIDILHLTCFLLNLGDTSKRYVVENNSFLFNDTGLVHQLVHLLTMSNFDLGERIMDTRDELVKLTQSAPEMFFTPEEWKSILESPYGKHSQ